MTDLPEDSGTKSEENDVPAASNTSDTISAEAKQEEASTETANSAKKNSGKRKIVLICASAILVLAVILILILQPWGKKSAGVVYTDGSGKVYHTEDYKAVAKNEPGKAYLTINTELEIQQLSYGEHFMYTFKMKEENGIGFHIDRMDHINFFYNGAVTVDTLTAEDVESWGDDPRIPPYGVYSILCGVSGRTPDGDPNAVAAALVVVGTDDNGEQLTFSTFVPLPLDEETK